MNEKTINYKKHVTQQFKLRITAFLCQLQWLHGNSRALCNV